MKVLLIGNDYGKVIPLAEYVKTELAKLEQTYKITALACSNSADANLAVLVYKPDMLFVEHFFNNDRGARNGWNVIETAQLLNEKILIYTIADKLNETLRIWYYAHNIPIVRTDDSGKEILNLIIEFSMIGNQ